MKKYPDCHGKLVSMKNWERKEIILKKLSEIEILLGLLCSRLGRGRGSTAVKHMPLEQKLERLWVQIPADGGLFSSHFHSFLTS